MRVLIISLLVVIVVFSGCKARSSEGIASFEDCVNAGFPVMKSLDNPDRCYTDDGKSFAKGIKPEGTCKDLCGDGVCQEVVCQAIGCPCAESLKACPMDCKK